MKNTHTEFICPFIPQLKHTLLMGHERVECSLRAPHVRHYRSRQVVFESVFCMTLTMICGQEAVLCSLSVPHFLHTSLVDFAAISVASSKYRTIFSYVKHIKQSACIEHQGRLCSPSGRHNQGSQYNLRHRPRPFPVLT